MFNCVYDIYFYNMQQIYCRLIKKSKRYNYFEIISNWKKDGYFSDLIPKLNKSLTDKDEYYYSLEFILEDDIINDWIVNGVDKL